MVRYILTERIVKCPVTSTVQDIRDCKECKMFKKEYMNHIECYYDDN